MVFIIIGVISFPYLIIWGCQNKLRVQGITVSRMTNPSLNLRIFFLWIFGVADIIHVLINLAIYIQCISLMPRRNIRVEFTNMCNVIMLIFLLIQTSFISYYRNATFVKNNVVNIDSIVILTALLFGLITWWVPLMCSACMLTPRFPEIAMSPTSFEYPPYRRNLTQKLHLSCYHQD